ncbi:hypothetical protein KEM54_001819 [Ascosphaera aggregata]|nr:hypothetical protein KEM54_001819 [Ascosphaera aggregata]
MGGPDNRVYWPPTMEHYLKPPKRVVGRKKTPKKKVSKVEIQEEGEEKEMIQTDEKVGTPTRRTRRKKTTTVTERENEAETPSKKLATPRATPRKRAKKKIIEELDSVTDEPTTPSLSEDEYTPVKKRTRKTKKA